MRRLRALMRKEFTHMQRDPRTLVFIFLMPVLQLVLLGYASNTDIKYVSTVVFDQDQSPASRALLAAYRNTDYFAFNYTAISQDEVMQLIEGGKVKAGIVIPSTYHSDLAAGRSAEVAVLIDGSDPTVAATVLSAATFIGQAHGTTILAQRLAAHGVTGTGTSPIDIRSRVLYNPDLNSSFNMIPSLIAMILMNTTTSLTSLAIVKEREAGTIEQLIVTPIRSWELIIAKITPYVLVSMAETLMILAIGTLWFGVPIRGGLALLLVLVGIYLLPNLGFGLLVSTFARTQREAQFMIMPIMLPSMMLSGFLFPVSALPQALQVISNILPLTYAIFILRSVIIKGAGMDLLWQPVLILVALAAVLIAAAVLRFRKSLD
jgi:ABC-2 type transport system permease protein